MFLLNNEIVKKVKDFLRDFSPDKTPALAGKFALYDYSGCKGSCFGCTGGCIDSCTGTCLGGCYGGCEGGCYGGCQDSSR